MTRTVAEPVRELNRAPHPATTRRDHHPDCECSDETLTAAWKAEMCTVLHAGAADDSRALLERFLAEYRGEIHRLLARVLRIAHLDCRDEDSAFSYFGQALTQMVNYRWRAKDGPGASAVFNYSRNLLYILEAETRSCIREDRRRGLLDGHAGVPGGASQDRKASHVNKSRQLYEIEYDCQPSDDELVAFHNERMRATRKDAARQGVLIARKDLRAPKAVPLDQSFMEADSRLSLDSAGGAAAVEWSDRIETILARCEQFDLTRERSRTRRLKRESVKAADVATVYFAHHALGQFPTRAEITAQLGISEPAARRELGVRLRVVLDVAREEFADYRRAR